MQKYSTLIVLQKKTKKHNPKWPEISDHLYWIIIIGRSGSGKTNVLLNLINNEPDIDKIYLHAKDPYEAKYQLLINEIENTGLKYLNDWKGFIEYSNDMDNIFKILKNTIQIENEKFWLYLMIWLLICLVIKNLFI